MSEKLLTPDDLKGIADKVHMAKIQEQFERVRKEQEEKRALHEAFLARDLDPDVRARVNAVVKRAAEQGLHEIQVVTFPASYCNDQGRRINNAEPDWPDSLEGFAKRAQEYFEAELKPLGFRARAQILNYPDGKPGDVGLFLGW
jgi:hypothetical protein